MKFVHDITDTPDANIRFLQHLLKEKQKFTDR
jgi:hypothetical protein